MERFQGGGAGIRIDRLLPLHCGQEIDGELLNQPGNFQGIDPEILLAGFTENLRPGKGKAPGDGEDIGQVFRLPPTQGTELVRKDIPPVVDAGIKMRLLKIAIVKRHIMSQFKSLHAPSLGRFLGSLSIDQPKFSAAATLP